MAPEKALCSGRLRSGGLLGAWHMPQAVHAALSFGQLAEKPELSGSQRLLLVMVRSCSPTFLLFGDFHLQPLSNLKGRAASALLHPACQPCLDRAMKTKGEAEHARPENTPLWLHAFPGC